MNKYKAHEGDSSVSLVFWMGENPKIAQILHKRQRGESTVLPEMEGGRGLYEVAVYIIPFSIILGI